VIAYHGDPKVKAKYVRRVQRHRKLDQLIPGATGSGGKGCAVYCTFDVYDHSRGPDEIGVPEVLMRLNDRIFESLATHATRDEYLAWPTQFLRSIRPGADLSMVWPQFALWLLRGLPERSLKRPDVKAAVERVAALYERWIAGDKPSVKEWREARSAAYAAAYAAAADAAAAAAAAYAAAAAAADADAADAAYAADADAVGARRSFWRGARDQLLALLAGAPTGQVQP
jgi:hypothetical protein